MYTKDDISVKKIKASRIDQINMEDPGFGHYFSDHMMVCDYNNGAWEKPKIQPYGPMEYEPSTKVFHYGQSIFEGMKAFKDKSDKVWLFRPDQNFERFNRSCKRMCMPEFPKEYFFGALDILMNLDKEWIPKKQGYSLYIRPFAIGIENHIAASPSENYRVMIITSPVKSYYDETKGGMKVLIQEKFSRSADGGVGYVKAGGNYGLSLYPTILANERGYGQVIWTDSSTHEYVEEAGTMNVFFRIGDTLLTAPTNDRILDGITRKSLIKLAKEKGIDIAIRPIKVQEIIEAHKTNQLKEIFGAGTATIVVPFSGFGFQEKDYKLPKIDDSYGLKLKNELQNIQYNRTDDKFGWLYGVD